MLLSIKRENGGLSQDSAILELSITGIELIREIWRSGFRPTDTSKKLLLRVVGTTLFIFRQPRTLSHPRRRKYKTDLYISVSVLMSAFVHDRFIKLK